MGVASQNAMPTNEQKRAWTCCLRQEMLHSSLSTKLAHTHSMANTTIPAHSTSWLGNAPILASSHSTREYPNHKRYFLGSMVYLHEPSPHGSQKMQPDSRKRVQISCVEIAMDSMKLESFSCDSATSISRSFTRQNLNLCITRPLQLFHIIPLKF